MTAPLIVERQLVLLRDLQARAADLRDKIAGALSRELGLEEHLDEPPIAVTERGRTLPRIPTTGSLNSQRILRMTLELHPTFPLPIIERRRAQVTSHFKCNPEAPTPWCNDDRDHHNGADLFYQVLKGELWPKGDGKATSNGRWVVPPGTPALAMLPGRVTQAKLTRTGWIVWVEHLLDLGQLPSVVQKLVGMKPFRVGYCHLREVFVRVGQYVRPAEQLGVVGDNPSDHDAAHLHLELSPTDRYAPIDPWLLLSCSMHVPLEETIGPARLVVRDLDRNIFRIEKLGLPPAEEEPTLPPLPRPSDAIPDSMEVPPPAPLPSAPTPPSTPPAESEAVPSPIDEAMDSARMVLTLWQRAKRLVAWARKLRRKR